MENNVDWHGKAPNDAEYEVAMERTACRDGRIGGVSMSEVKKIATP